MIAQILVVDDDPVQRRLLKSALERHDHVVHLAENGLVALDVIRHGGEPIDVVVLDLMMPEMDGLGFLLAAREAGIETPVIVQTGQGGIETVVQAIDRKSVVEGKRVSVRVATSGRRIIKKKKRMNITHS